MARDLDPYKLSSPRIFFIRMLIFLVLAACVTAVLYRQLYIAFMANPGLNGLIIFTLLLGIVFGFRQVIRLLPEVRWVNAYRLRDPGLELRDQPVMLAPMATLLGDKVGRRSISLSTLRSILESIGMRLDEQREVSRYLTGLLVFLGLLGTFWGLIETVGSVGNVINSMSVGGGDASTVFESLKSGLAAPLKGMGVSFSSSLFGLAGSLILGFLDLQAGQAQNRFYTELEDWLAATVTDIEAEGLARGGSDGEMAAIKSAIERMADGSREAGSGRNATAAMAQLAEGIQGLVQHMRSEQQMIRDWVESQAEQQRDIKSVLERLTQEREKN
ncbi:flagellar motor protein MotA [Labrys portucalensis]|uniref:Flagellar motor protein MotA n=1 Tax=Labrys neptuniae TaxID=376174 RepID=A0ABV3PPZ3_9HYPH|nr:flagellar motor protein MotA [Labrys neptuniae]MDT3375847.1 flagellar motor protein MotA [Labrys neptuniae]